jgi:hypothetical protein
VEPGPHAANFRWCDTTQKQHRKFQKNKLHPKGYQLCRQVRLFFSRPSPGEEEGTVTTPLHLAAYFGHRDALLILVAKFRNVEVLDGRGRSPLYLASYAGKTTTKILGFECR